ncbi:MAG: HEPN domain-containing protein [Gammaproteobacteria bacterium]|nr:HEPN domain-containing protein [Gammaproteobacteria bacterium]NNJ85170.1 HEPN domain-containing protein [Gammaproteobacteria bacterium]
MYQERLQRFENVKNLGGKAWQHGVGIDLLEKTNIEDCSIHCFHYQQMFEMLFKHLLETKSRYGAYSRTHKLHKLLEEVSENTPFETDNTKYRMALQVITVCAEEYRYNFLIDCGGYRDSVEIADGLLRELLAFEGE